MNTIADMRIAGTALDGNWMQTFTGKQFWPLNPKVHDIDIEDIAHALSMLCRFGGHCNRFYSVAEHCVHISDNVPPEDALWGLLHDASEAYLVDVPRPIKPFLTSYKAIEANLMLAVCERFGLPLVMPDSVRKADTSILIDERDQNMARPPHPWDDEVSPLGVELKFWAPQMAESIFLDVFQKRMMKTVY